MTVPQRPEEVQARHYAAWRVHNYGHKYRPLFHRKVLDCEDQNLPLIKEHSAAVQTLRDGKIQEAIIQFRKIAKERGDKLAGSIAELHSERKYELRGIEPDFLIETK